MMADEKIGSPASNNAFILPPAGDRAVEVASGIPFIHKIHITTAASFSHYRPSWFEGKIPRKTSSPKGNRKHMPSKPTYEQAQLHLQVYEMRREAKLRQARDWFFRNYFVDSLDDVMRVAAPGTEQGAFAMMIFSYWDQACALLNYGLLHEELFFETSGEFFGVWERVKPILQQARERFVNQHFLENLEKAAQRYETWIEARSPGHIAAMRDFGKQMRAQMGKTATA